MSRGLHEAVGLIDEARSRAVLRGDEQQAMRLDVLASRVELEAEYDTNVAAGLPMVWRRDLLAGCTIGWLFRYCAATREARRALGVSVPKAGQVDIVTLNGLAA